MLKNLKYVVSAILMASMAAPSQALEMTTGGLISPYFLSTSSGGNSSYDGAFTLLGFNTDNQQIDSAVAYFAFSDGYKADRYWEYVDISLGGSLLFDNLEVNGTHKNAPANYAWYSAPLSLSMLANLDVDGSIDFRVQLLNIPRNKDNTWLKGAKLIAQVSAIPPPPTASVRVADGGATLGLLALAMGGLTTLRRKVTRK